MSRQYYELSIYDVGNATIHAFGKTIWAVDFIGRILPRDVGKRVFMVGDVPQVENDEQRERRLQRGA